MWILFFFFSVSRFFRLCCSILHVRNQNSSSKIFITVARASEIWIRLLYGVCSIRCDTLFANHFSLERHAVRVFADIDPLKQMGLKQPVMGVSGCVDLCVSQWLRTNTISSNHSIYITAKKREKNIYLSVQLLLQFSVCVLCFMSIWFIMSNASSCCYAFALVAYQLFER